MNKKAWIYCRCATNNHYELNHKIKYMKEFAKRKGIDVVGVTSDVGSGLDTKRKGLLEIAKVSKLKKTDMILTRSIDRISRNFIEAVEFISQIKKYIEFRTIDDFNGQFIEYKLMFLTALKNTKKEQII